MEVHEYGCKVCRGTFKVPRLDNKKTDRNIKCPGCGGNNIEKLDSPADKLKFYTQFAWGGG